MTLIPPNRVTPTPQNSPAVARDGFETAVPHPLQNQDRRLPDTMSHHRARHLDGLATLTAETKKTADKGDGILPYETGYDLDNLDLSVDPTQDFYHYATGGWLKRNPEPPVGHSQWGTFHALDKLTKERLNKLFDEAPPANDVDFQKGKTLYESYLNMEQRNAAGITPLTPYIKAIQAVDTPEAFFDAWMEQKKLGSCAFTNTGSDTHPYRARYNIFCFSEGGVNLPDHDMYLPERDTTENGHAEIREKYRAYVEAIWEKLSLPHMSPSEAADAIIAIETEIARARWTKEDRRNPDLVCNVYTVAELNQLAPEFPFDRLFAALEVEPQDVEVMNPKLIQRVTELLSHTPLEHLKAYLTFCLVNAAAPHLDEWFENTHFDFFGKTLRGVEEQKPAKERATELSSGLLGEAIGKAYAKRWFPPHRKARVEEMVKRIKEALVTIIDNLDWMGEETKLKAIEKVRATTIQVGYPDDGHWKDYSTVTISPDQPLITNVLECWRFLEQEELDEVEKPADIKKWPWPPQTVNACNSPSLNRLTFPAGILAPPFVTDDEAVCWGAFGAVIAHEIIHSFDDQGRKFAADGRKEDWWTKEDAEKFEVQGKILADYFDNLHITFSDGSSIPVRGRMCLGENIADFGGLITAYEAFEKEFEGRKKELYQGFTPAQRFFLGWAQVWASTTLEEEAKRRLSSDPHSPPLWRVNAPLAQFPAFWQAFNVPDGSGMRAPPEKICRMWFSNRKPPFKV